MVSIPWLFYFQRYECHVYLSRYDNFSYVQQMKHETNRKLIWILQWIQRFISIKKCTFCIYHRCSYLISLSWSIITAFCRNNIICVFYENAVILNYSNIHLCLFQYFQCSIFLLCTLHKRTVFRLCGSERTIESFVASIIHLLYFEVNKICLNRAENRTLSANVAQYGQMSCFTCYNRTTPP